MSRKVAPSEMVREQIEQTLCGGVDEQTNLISTLAQLGMKHLVQQDPYYLSFSIRRRNERRQERS